MSCSHHDDPPCLADGLEPTGMVGMKMRENHVLQVLRAHASLLELLVNRMAGWQDGDVQAVMESAQVPHRIGTDVCMPAGIDEDETLRMLDEECEHGQYDLAGLGSEPPSERQRGVLRGAYGRQSRVERVDGPC